MGFDLQEIIIRVPAVLLALTVHEFAHGWVALRLGDRTAYDAGRLTFNPVAHLDIVGTLMLMWGPFGWAKPVPVDPRFFKDPKKGTLYVSLAGPVSNVILALLFGYTIRLIGFITPVLAHNPHFIKFLDLSVLINTGIAFFNLLPVPPLDGSKIVLGLLPNRMIPGYVEKTRYLPMIFLILLVLDWADILPLFSKLFFPLFLPFQALILFFINIGVSP